MCIRDRYAGYLIHSSILCLPKSSNLSGAAAVSYTHLADRYDIRFDVNDYYGGLHCGDCMEVFVRGKWKPTRMEYGDNWYLATVILERGFFSIIFFRASARALFVIVDIIPPCFDSGSYLSLSLIHI